MIQESEALLCSLTKADSSFVETVDNNPVILKMEACLNINEHAEYYKSLSLFSLLLLFPRERLVASPAQKYLGNKLVFDLLAPRIFENRPCR